MVSGPDRSRVGATSTWRITPGWLLSWPTLGRQLCLFQALSEFLRERCRESADVFFMSVLHEALPDRVRILEDLLPVLVRQPVVNLRIFTSSHRTHDDAVLVGGPHRAGAAQETGTVWTTDKD